MQAPPPSRADLDHLAAELRDEIRALRAELYREQRQRLLIVALVANALLVALIVGVAELLAG